MHSLFRSALVWRKYAGTIQTISHSGESGQQGECTTSSQPGRSRLLCLLFRCSCQAKITFFLSTGGCTLSEQDDSTIQRRIGTPREANRATARGAKAGV
ncbi:hypothetical protein AVEN_85947-1 [Araneus ventricosus]|uniref:Uncharacterized protein n=1 Tax=Araneus ventricosus TaxID=182803 RepID=A0A4Y2NUC0_ARAVE|nr:hypothetical protein AVEN_85947-1 [Araneus ventricosus]